MFGNIAKTKVQLDREDIEVKTSEKDIITELLLIKTRNSKLEQ